METLKFCFCLCLIIASAVQANPATTPTIEVSAEQLKIAAGESGSVTCTPGGNPLPSVQWRKHEGEIGAGTEISGNTLSIRDAQANDRGYYVCVGVLGATDVAQKYVYVDIENVDESTQSNPTVTVSQRTISIPRGGSGSVECIPKGNPLPRVQWIKSNGELRSGISSNGNTLIISDAREEDYGDYVCQGIVDGTVMVTDYLRVMIENVESSTQGNPTVAVSQRTISIPRGGSGSVECIPKGNPLPRVQWIKSNGELRSGISSNGNTLIISDAREEDYGDYVCQGIVDGTVMVTDYLRVMIENVESSTQGNPTVAVSQRTISIPRGGSGSVECIPRGNPLPRVQWIKSNGELRSGISSNGNTLIISDAREEDYGDYVCQGIVDGTVMVTDYLRVIIENVESSTQGNPTVAVSQRTISIPRGGSGSVECIPKGNPLPRVQWIKSNGELRSGISSNGNTLIISDAREEDYGDYVCQGIVDGTVMVTDYLRVIIENVESSTQGNPTVAVSQRTISIPRGGSGSVECIPKGNPLPRVQWIKSNGELRSGISSNGNTLIISDAREEDYGDYVCQGIVDGTVMVTDYLRVIIENVESSTQGNPTVAVSQRTISIPRGGSGSVECIPKGNPLPRVQWIKSNGELRSGISSNGNTLIISDAWEEDYGDYVCQGIVDGTVMVTDYLRVIIENVESSTQGNPTVAVSQRTISIPRGGSGSVECIPKGNPLPRVQWIKSNGELRSGISSNGNTLIISDAREEDYGDYVCQGIVDGTVMVTDYLRVIIENVESSTQGNPTVAVSQQTISIPRGGSGSVECIPKGNPLPRVQWIKSNGELRSGISSNGNTLIISDAREEDYGDYVCQGIVDGTVMVTDYLRVIIENVDPLAQSNLKVTVSQRTLLIPLGGQGTIECTPEGNPLPRVQWIKSDAQFREGISQSGNTLIISDAREEDRGHYVCQGIVDGTVMLTNYTSVEIDNPATTAVEKSKVSVSVDRLKVPVGEIGSITCTPGGYPLPSIQWRKHAGELSPGTSISGNTLTITNAQEGDQGYYFCVGVVANAVIAQKYVKVEIEKGGSQGPPVPPQRNMKLIVSERELRIPEGGKGTIECTPEGDPLPRVQWIKSNGEFGDRIRTSGNTLIFSDFRMEDRGHYSCQGIVDGTVMLTNYSSVDIERRSPSPVTPQTPQLPGNPKVTVSEREPRIPLGGSAAIECTPEGNPLPTVRWIKSNGEFGDRIRPSGNALIFSDFRKEDRGHYACQGIVEGTVMVTDYSAVDIESNEGRPELLPKQIDVVMSEGSYSTISCDFETGDSEQKVAWTRRDQRPLPQNLQVLGQELVIQSATKEDSGEYLCKVTASRGGLLLRVAYVRLEVLALPVVSVHPPVQTVAHGGTVTIECVVNRDAQVSWDRVDGSLSSRVEIWRSKLVINEIEVEDSGYYRCSSRNRDGVVSSEIAQVIVNDEPQTAPPANLRSPNVVVSQRELTTSLGESVSIDCTPEGSPLPTVRWIKSDGEFRDGIGQNGNTLIISDAREEDEAHYVCQGIVDGTVMATDFSAIHVETETQTAPPGNLRSPNVVVSQKQLTISPGESGSIDCIPEGSPLPRVQWVKSNGEFRDGIRQDGNTLIISDARKEDEAHYVCQGIVDGTVMVTDFSAIYIQSDERPSVVAGNPRVQVNVRQLKIPKGGSGTVECTPEGNPLPTIQWSKHEGTFSVGTRQSGNALIISDAQEQDRGYYVCDGMVDGTAAWTDYLAVEIESNEPSQLQSYPRVTVNVRQLRIPRGGTVAIECVPEGSPLPTIQWTKDGGNFGIGTRQSGNSLVIKDAQEEDRGNYVCSAVVDGIPVFSDYLTVEIQYICELPQETGTCRAAFERWYYDATQQKCQKFIWGGCGGNKNNFETEEQCSLECERMRPNAA